MSSEDTRGLRDKIATAIYSAWHSSVPPDLSEADIYAEYLHAADVVLAGRVVVDLPEPVAGTKQSWSSPAGRIGLCMPKNPDTHRPLVAVGNRWVLTEAETEQLAHALLAAVRLAAADAAERLSGEVRNDQ